MAIEAAVFKEVLSRFASGVTVVTTLCDGVPHGLTVSAFSSVSASPPRVLICLNNTTDSKPLIDRSGLFAVHILGRSHVGLGPRFAKMIPGLRDPFEGLLSRVESTGCPILAECLAWLDCRVMARLAVGDNTIFVGDVMAAGVTASDADPLLYYRRGFRVLDATNLEPL